MLLQSKQTCLYFVRNAIMLRKYHHCLHAVVVGTSVKYTQTHPHTQSQLTSEHLTINSYVKFLAVLFVSVTR